MEQLKHMKKSLIAAVESQLGNLGQVDAKELGEAIDMIKDLEEAIYYCTIVKSMEEKDEEKKHMPAMVQYYTEPMHYNRYYQEDPRAYNDRDRRGFDEPMMYRDMDRGMGKMYYNGGGQGSSSSMGGGSNGGGGSRNYSEREYPIEIRDYREGRSPLSRRNYMESKELHKDKAFQTQELEKYMRELSDDLTEMVENSSPEEKQLLSKKLSTLATKIV